jgi:hypothetical protein
MKKKHLKSPGIYYGNTNHKLPSCSIPPRPPENDSFLICKVL